MLYLSIFLIIFDIHLYIYEDSSMAKSLNIFQFVDINHHLFNSTYNTFISSSNNLIYSNIYSKEFGNISGVYINIVNNFRLEILE